MFFPTVIESPSALEPVAPDPFIDVPEQPLQPAPPASAGAQAPVQTSTPRELR